MKTFVQWAEDNGYEIPVLTDTEPKKKSSSENRIRTGITANYPPAYSKAQYPDGYNPPYKGTAVLDMKQKAAPSYGGQKAAN
jgi:hypothetical protein